MKKVGFISLLSLLLISFFTCDMFEENNDSESQSVMVYITHYYTGRRAPDWQRISVPSIHVSGEILGDPYPEVKDFQVCGQQFDDPSHVYINTGSVYFTSYERIWEDSIPEPKFNPINFKISTDIGSISGSITVPDTIETLTVSQHDTVALQTPVTISWTGGSADFYYVYWEHSWMMEDGYGWLMYSRDTMIQGNSVTLSGSNFTLDGFIESIEVYPENGPFPEPGVEANLEGDGFGYMYLENKYITSDVRVVFGTGIPEEWLEWLKKPAASAPTQEERSKKIQEKIRMRLGL